MKTIWRLAVTGWDVQCTWDVAASPPFYGHFFRAAGYDVLGLTPSSSSPSQAFYPQRAVTRSGRVVTLMVSTDRLWSLEAVNWRKGGSRGVHAYLAGILTMSKDRSIASLPLVSMRTTSTRKGLRDAPTFNPFVRSTVHAFVGIPSGARDAGSGKFGRQSSPVQVHGAYYMTR